MPRGATAVQRASYGGALPARASAMTAMLGASLEPELEGLRSRPSSASSDSRTSSARESPNLTGDFILAEILVLAGTASAGGMHRQPVLGFLPG